MANVHKDFHGALSYGIQFVIDNYGMDGFKKYIKGLSTSVYTPLVNDMKKDGLSAVQKHFEEIFTLEGGKFEFREEDDALVFDVKECPAIAHMKAQGYEISPHFCEHTRLLNEAICNEAGYSSSVDYNQEEGRCVQRFWKEKV